MAKRQNLDGKMGEAASNSKFAALALAVVGASPAAVTAVDTTAPKGKGRGKKPDIANLTEGAVASLTIGAKGKQQPTGDVAPTVTWSGGGWTCSVGANGQRMVSYGGQSYPVFRVNPASDGGGIRVVYTLNAAEDGSCPHAIGVLPADAPADPWVLIAVALGKDAKEVPTDQNAKLLSGAAVGSIAGAGVQTPEEQVAGAIKMLRPIQTEGRAALSMMDRTNEALYVVGAHIVEWAMSLSDAVLGKVIEQELGKTYAPELMFTQVARLGFDLRNEDGDSPETRRKNKTTTAAVFRIAKGLRRIWNTFSERAAAGEPASCEFVVKLLLAPGSGGFSGAGSLLYPADDDDAGAEGGGAGDAAGSGQGGAGPDGGAGGGDTSGTGNARGDGDAGAGSNNGGDSTGDPSGATPKGAKGAGTAKKQARTSTPPDTKRFQALPELRPENLPAAYRVAGTVFAGALRVADDGKPVLIAATDITTPIARALLPAKSSATVDCGAKFIGGLLTVAHYVFSYKLYQNTYNKSKIIIAGNGGVSKALLAENNDAESILVSAIPNGEFALPIGGALLFDGQDLKRENFTLLTKIKKGEGSVSATIDQAGGLTRIDLVADGASPMALTVSAYSADVPIGEVDINQAFVAVTLTAVQSGRIWEKIKAIASEAKVSGFMLFEFDGGKIKSAQVRASSDVGWNAKKYVNGTAFFVSLPDLVRIYKTIKRLASKTIPVFRADPRGLLVVELTADCGTYSIAVPAIYPGTATRRSDFCRPFTPDITPEAEGAAQDEATSDDDKEASGEAPGGDDEQSTSKA